MAPTAPVSAASEPTSSLRNERMTWSEVEHDCCTQAGLAASVQKQSPQPA